MFESYLDGNQNLLTSKKRMMQPKLNNIINLWQYNDFFFLSFWRSERRICKASAEKSNERMKLWWFGLISISWKPNYGMFCHKGKDTQ